MKKVATPLTGEQLSKKIRSGKMKIIQPKSVLGIGSIGGKKWTDNDIEFLSVQMGGVFSWPDDVGVDGNGKEHKFPGGTGFRFTWAAKGIGFGEFELKKLTNGTLEFNAEKMGREFFKKALCALVDTAKDRHQEVQ
jgi:hypothetical protein